MVIGDLSVCADDLFRLLSHSWIEKLVLFDIDLTIGDISTLESASKCRVEALSRRIGDEV